MEKMLFLVGCCPPPEWFIAMLEDCQKNPSEKDVTVLLWGRESTTPGTVSPGHW